MGTTERSASGAVRHESNEPEGESLTADSRRHSRDRDEADRTASDDVYRIVAAMDSEGVMRVSPLGRRETYEIVEYIDPYVTERLSSQSAGATVRLELSPLVADGDADAYVATRVRPGSPGVVA